MHKLVGSGLMCSKSLRRFVVGGYAFIFRDQRRLNERVVIFLGVEYNMFLGMKVLQIAETSRFNRVSELYVR